MDTKEEKKNLFSDLTDDIILNIFFKLESDPRDWARLSCVSTKFSSLISDFCWKSKCSQSIPSDLLSAAHPPLLSLHKLSLCCPGLLLAGLLHDSSDFGLERDLGPDHPLSPQPHPHPPRYTHHSSSSSSSSSHWSLFDDLYYDTLYDPSESEGPQFTETVSARVVEAPQFTETVIEAPRFTETVSEGAVEAPGFTETVRAGVVGSAWKRRKVCGPRSSHLAWGSWSLSREQGSKLLARQFRDDCLYVCDWPGCVHEEEKRNYCLFRGVFKNFKRTRVWRTINDGKRRKLDLPCAFCSCNFTWDLHSAFCLRRGFGFHDDGEPVVRAYVCENGHVSGAWTDVPMYT